MPKPVVPPYRPAGHTAAFAEVLPDGQKCPMLQGPVQSELVRPLALPYLPEGHSGQLLVMLVASCSELYRPIGQFTQSNTLPEVVRYLPAGHSAGRSQMYGNVAPQSSSAKALVPEGDEVRAQFSVSHGKPPSSGCPMLQIWSARVFPRLPLLGYPTSTSISEAVLPSVHRQSWVPTSFAPIQHLPCACVHTLDAR